MRSDLKNRSANSTRASPAITKRLKSVEDLANPCSSSSRGSCFKESVNNNKSDTTKLSAEPLPMKRKKKGGGYNLRNSLAWDRAFFTEEGVLDPIELSTISGTSCGEGLFAIDEEISSGSCYPMESADTPAIGNDLIKEPPTGALVKYRSDCPSPKPNSSAPNDVISTSMTSQKSTCPSSKFGSNCGDSTRSLPTSSLKRPANTTVAKSATNALKLLKVPVSKSGPRVSYLKHDQVTEPVVSIQRNIGSKRSSKSQKNAEDTSKAGTLRPPRHSKGNSKGQSSIDKSPLPVDKPSNSGSKMISDIMVPFNPGHSFETRDPTTISISVAQKACSSGGNMHPSPNQAPRPSGLRMPSPSLSFFSQPKTSGSCSLSWRNTDSNVCGIKKLENLRSRNTLRKSPKLANGTEASTSNCNRLISSRSECSAPFEVNAISCGIIESNMEENSAQKVETKVLVDANSSEPRGNNIDINGQIQDVLKQIEIEKIIPQEDIEFQKNDKEVPLRSTSSEKVTDDIKLKSTILGSPGNRESYMSGWGNSNLVSPHDCLMLGTSESDTEAATDEQHEEPIICKFSVSKHDIRSQTLTAGSNLVETCMKDCHEPPREQIDQLKGPTGDGHNLKTNRRDNEPAKASQEYGSWHCGNLDYEALESNMKSPCSASKNEHKDLSVEAATTDARTYNSLVGQAQLQAPEDILTTENSKNNISHLLVVGAINEQSGKASELEDINQEVEQDSQNNYLHTSDWLLPENQACCIESLQEKLAETLPVVAMAGKDVNQFFDVYMERTQAPAAVHDADLNIDKMIKQPLIRDKQFNSTENSQLSESRDILIDLTSSYDGVLAAEANYFKLKSSPNEVTKSFVRGDGRLPDDNDMWNMGIYELKADLLLDTASKQLSNSPHQETQATEINYSSLFSRSMVFEEPQQIIIEKTIDSRPMLDDYHEKNLRISGVDKESTGSGTEDLMVQSYDKALNECCVELTSTDPSQYIRDADCDEQSGHLKMPNPVVVEDLFRSNDGLPLKNCSPSVTSIISDEYDQTSVLDSMVDSVTKPSDLHGGEIRSSVDVEKPILMHKTCRDADEIVSQLCIQYQNKIEGSQDGSTSVSDESDKDKAAFAAINKFCDGLKKKSHTFVPPQNAVPFSDEWLAAIEAAGEDILTVKSGAVKHSPPDKSLPERNPWSPVKRKTNQIGPFDCTKFTSISPSNSS
ncbi:uncharacterized protein LOC111379418 isoform X3 [Olea europaea var. sylvestris]|uniref:uncharacterized protein LOC111379418 isoform X3 n=1 Tax=Olea europaea var. sylvestris TaxID=158386 RepID=UPI000C1D6C84|nr:uncharacterized protein LOC111379418 isoform X3 [Olea europaea var. sylvestris]